VKAVSVSVARQACDFSASVAKDETSNMSSSSLCSFYQRET